MKLSRILFTTLLVLASSWSLAETITISKSKLQLMLAPKVAVMEKTFYTTIKMHSVQVALDEKTNRMTVNFTADALKPLALKAAATGEIESLVLFDAKKGNLYLHGPVVYNLQYGNMEHEYATSVGDATREAAQKLQGAVIYTVGDRAALKQLAKSEVLSVAVKGDKLVVTLGEKKKGGKKK